METQKLLDRALQFDFLNANEGLFLFENAATSDLMFVANELRKKQVPSNKVTWIIEEMLTQQMFVMPIVNFATSSEYRDTKMLTLLH